MSEKDIEWAWRRKHWKFFAVWISSGSLSLVGLLLGWGTGLPGMVSIFCVGYYCGHYDYFSFEKFREEIAKQND